MEWHIMNAGGVTSLGSNLGSLEDCRYIPSDECRDVLEEILCQLKHEDPTYRNTRQQIFYSRLVEKELCPMLRYLQDEEEIFALVIKVVANLTQPIEVLLQPSALSAAEDIPWQEGIENSLCYYRNLLTDKKLIKKIFEEMRILIDDSEGYPLSEESCDSMNQMLLLVRNLLHFPYASEDGSCDEHGQFLRTLFECDFTERILQFLQLCQREFWTVTLVQIISLIFKGHVGEMFLRSSMSDSDSESVLSENNTDTQECLMCGSQHSDKDLQCLEDDFTKALKMRGSSSSSLSSDKSSNNENGEQRNTEKAKEKLVKYLNKFAYQLLTNGFCNMVHDLRHILISPSKAMIDDVYLLWMLAFFMKFARYQHVPFKVIKSVFSTDVYNYLVYEGIVNSEELVVAQKNKQDTTNYIRRLHLTVSALREMLRGLKSYSEETQLDMVDRSYLAYLQKDLASTLDLPQLFLLLIRHFQMHTHNLKFLQDVVVTNHLLLILIDQWSKSGYCRKKFQMLDHVKQFATVEVMQKYGRLLEDFQYNSIVVNNCIFTMMHHIAGDCGQPTALLQVQILRTFLEILDSDLPLSREKNDLIEFIMQKFMMEAESNPFSCALQLFGEMPAEFQGEHAEEKSKEGRPRTKDNKSQEWTKEEKDILLMLYTDLMDQPDCLGTISNKLQQYGIDKTEKEIANQLKELDWFMEDRQPMEVKSQSSEDDSSEETDMDQSSQSQVDEILAECDDSEVIPYCVGKLVESGNEKHLKWLQNQLCEVAFAKFACSLNDKEKKEAEEPVARFHVIQNKSVPLVLYNEEQEHLIHDPYFATLLQFLGLHMPEDVSMLFPRIPHFWSIQHLVDSAKLLGELSNEQLKFDPAQLKEEQEYTEIPCVFKIRDTHDFNKANKDGRKKVPESLWINMIHQYNKHPESSEHFDKLSTSKLQKQVSFSPQDVD